MIQSFFTAGGVVLPVCVLLGCGALLRGRGVLKEGLIPPMNGLVYRLFLPASLFKNCYGSSLALGENLGAILFCCLSLFAVFLLCIPLTGAAEGDGRRRSVMLQGVFRGNLAMFGMPVLSLLCPGEDLGMAAILLAFLIPELNVLAVLCFALFAEGRANWRGLLPRLGKNPLLLAILLGVSAKLLKLELPGFLLKAIEALGGVATPLALVLLGAGFSPGALGPNGRALALMLGGKLLALPLLTLGAGLLLGFRGPVLSAAVILFSAPVAVASAPMAQEMGGDVALASQAVLLSTLLGVFSMFGWISCLSLAGLV